LKKKKKHDEESYGSEEHVAVKDIGEENDRAEQSRRKNILEKIFIGGRRNGECIDRASKSWKE
jgi:hypothetical protein